MDLYGKVEGQVLALLVKEGMFVCVACLSHC